MDLVLLLKLVNTPGNEIAPRSDIVGKDLQDHLFSHAFLHLGRVFKNRSKVHSAKSNS